jgi:uncharacterized protein
VHPDAQQLIRELGLKPHPEGGYFAETYRSGIYVDSDARTRNAVTSIYYLLPGDTFSAFHRLRSDEIWHHYRGAAVTIEAIDIDAQHHRLVLGDGARWQATIPASWWFAAHINDPACYALVGCDVAPGFDFEDFEIGSRAQLLSAFPQHAQLIGRLTRDD